MNEPARDQPSWKQSLSEALDGEGGDAARNASLDAWSQHVEARRAWHEFHLIGDVLRSEDLATDPARDAAFLASFRARLAAEPVVLAPSAPVRRRRRLVWAAPMAVAAGFVAVAGVVVVLRLGAPAAEAPAPLAQGAPAAQPLRVSATPAEAAPGQMLRDARIDEYLRAHRATLAGSPAALPGGAMRNVELIVPQR